MLEAVPHRTEKGAENGAQEGWKGEMRQIPRGMMTKAPISSSDPRRGIRCVLGSKQSLERKLDRWFMGDEGEDSRAAAGPQLG